MTPVDQCLSPKTKVQLILGRESLHLALETCLLSTGVKIGCEDVSDLFEMEVLKLRLQRGIVGTSSG